MNENNQIKQKETKIYERQAEICSAFSHPIRLQIIDLLQNGKMNCSEILEVLKIPKPNLSQHLNVLKRARLVGCKKSGLFQIYYLTNPQIKSACENLRHILTNESTTLLEDQQ